MANDKQVWTNFSVSNVKVQALHADAKKAQEAANKARKAFLDAVVPMLTAKLGVNPATHEVVIADRFGLAYAVKEKSGKSAKAGTLEL